MPNSNYLKKIGFEKRTYTQDYEMCAHCVYYDRTDKYPDDRYCNKHRMFIGVCDICKDYFDLMETPEGKKAGAIMRKLALNFEAGKQK